MESYKCGHPRTVENSYVRTTDSGRSESRCATCCKKDSKGRYVYAPKKDSFLKRRKENPARHMINRAKISAKHRGLAFSITEADILPLPETCPVLGMTLDYMGTGGRNQGCSASLDRRDNSKGYVPGNVFVISHRANVLKRNATLEEMQSLLDYMKR